MENILKVSIDLIKPNRYQPRTTFNDDKLMELAMSIKENGLIQPIVVRKEADHYEIIAGERRFRACILAGLVEVDVVVKDVDNVSLGQMALVENIQRENLSAIEEAKAILNLIEKYNLTQTSIAKQLGKSQSTVANKLRLLNLHTDVQQAILNKEISERHARALLSLDYDKQLKILKIIIEKGLTVKQTEALVLNEKEEKVRKPLTKGYSKNHQLAINTINQAVKMSNKFGINSQIVQEDLDDKIRLIITIEK